MRRIPDIRFEEENPGYEKDQVDAVLASLADPPDGFGALIDRCCGRR